jgi:hypothetical protein
VSSTDSGADDPVACEGGTGAAAATYFDAKFCNSGLHRLLLINDATALAVAGAQVPQWHMILALVNTPIYGGGGGDNVATFSMAPNVLRLPSTMAIRLGLLDEWRIRSVRC